VAHLRNEVGEVTSTSYDTLGRVTQIVGAPYLAPGASSTISPTVAMSYDPFGNVIAITDQVGAVTNVDYDMRGRAVRIQSPTVNSQRATSRSIYDDVGNEIETAAASGAVTVQTYDGLDRLAASTLVERSGGPTSNALTNITTSYSYDDASRQLSVTTPGSSKTATYNLAGDLLSAGDAGGTSTYGYDWAGRPSSRTAPSGVVSRVLYDAFENPAVVEKRDASNALLSSVTSGFDAAGRITSFIDAAGHTSTYTLNALGWLTESVVPTSATESIATSAGYDALGRRTRDTDGNGHSTWTTFSALGKPQSLVEPSTPTYPAYADRRWLYTYDGAGQVTKEEGPGGVVTNNTYDAAGRLVGQTGSGAAATTADRSFSYDVAGRLTSYSTPNASSSVTYNDRDLPLVVSGASPATMSYDDGGNATSVADSSGTTSYTWNSQSQMMSATDPLSGATVSYTYGPGGRPATTDYGGGVVRTYSYDTADRLTVDALTNGSTTLRQDAYTYDANDNLTSKATTGPVSGAGTNTYGYDWANRLTSWTDPASVATAYAYDGAGNRTSAGGTNYTYNARNQLLTSVSGGTATTYGYDARGTRSTMQVGTAAPVTSTFDAFDQLITDGPVTYSYDALARTATRNGTSTSWSGMTQNLSSDGTTSYSYTAGGRSLGTKTGGTGHQLIDDRHGDIVGTLVPGAGSLAGSRTFDPYGVEMSASGSVPSLGYQGDYTDPTTGKVNANARWYDPTTGTFASRDTLDDPNSSNRYGYGVASPILNLDPSGHQCTCGSDWTVWDDIGQKIDRAIEDAKRAANRALTAAGAAVAGFLGNYFRTSITFQTYAIIGSCVVCILALRHVRSGSGVRQELPGPLYASPPTAAWAGPAVPVYGNPCYGYCGPAPRWGPGPRWQPIPKPVPPPCIYFCGLSGTPQIPVDGLGVPGQSTTTIQEVGALPGPGVVSQITKSNPRRQKKTQVESDRSAVTDPGVAPLPDPRLFGQDEDDDRCGKPGAFSGSIGAQPGAIGRHRDISTSIGCERHHIVQDAWGKLLRDKAVQISPSAPGAEYSSKLAPSIVLTKEQHGPATQVQMSSRECSGTLRGELKVARNSLEAAQVSPDLIERAVGAAESYFRDELHVGLDAYVGVPKGRFNCG
jgi:RHS repeat-associated protein